MESLDVSDVGSLELSSNFRMNCNEFEDRLRN